MSAGRSGFAGRTSGILGAIGATFCVRQGMRWWPPGEAALRERTNFRGEVVDLYAGPATALGTAAAVITSPALPVRTRAATVLAVLAAGGCGAYDDMVGRNDPRRGFRAHLGALRRGEVTSGAVKLLGIGAAGLAAGTLLKEGVVDRVLAGVVVAGAAVVLDDDLKRRTMLGDTGAHALGAAVGAAVVAGSGRTGLALHAAALTVAAVCGDRVSRAAGAA